MFPNIKDHPKIYMGVLTYLSALKRERRKKKLRE